MIVKHNPIFDTDKIISYYEERDGVPITYVCTSALNHGTLATDVFYREDPHPEYGNRYFALYMNNQNQIMITNADCIEDLEFTMVEVDGELHYSQHRHDFRTIGNVSIDGGRAYVRRVGDLSVPVKNMKVKNGGLLSCDVHNSGNK